MKTDTILYNERLNNIYKKLISETIEHFSKKGYDLSKEGIKEVKNISKEVKRYSPKKEQRVKNFIDKRKSAKLFEKDIIIDFNEKGNGPSVIKNLGKIKASQNENKAFARIMEKQIKARIDESKLLDNKARRDVLGDQINGMNYFDDIITNEKGELLNSDNMYEAESVNLNDASPEWINELFKFNDPIFYPGTTGIVKTIAASNRISSWEMKSGVNYKSLAAKLGISESDLWLTIKNLCPDSDQYEEGLQSIDALNSQLENIERVANIDPRVRENFSLIGTYDIFELKEKVELGEKIIEAINSGIDPLDVI